MSQVSSPKCQVSKGVKLTVLDERREPATTGSPRRPLRFFGLVCLLATPFWVIGAFVSGPGGLPMDLPIGALMFPCPLIAAAILLRRADGPGSASRLLHRVFQIRGALPWTAASVALMPAIMLVTYALMRATGAPVSGPHTPWLLTPVLMAVFLIGAVGEEAGWMGYAVDPLHERFGELWAGLILGAVWAAWHLVPLVQAHRSTGWIAGWFVATVAARVVIVRLYRTTGKSIVPAIVVHDMINVTGSLLPNYPSHYVTVFSGAITAVVAVLCWIRKPG